MNNKLTYEFIENLRKSAGTLPSEYPEKRTNILNLEESIEVELVDHNANPYKAMFLTSTATWGNNEFVNKWPITNIKGKFEVIKAVLTHNTLPQAREVINFIFRVKGVPRWLFDYHTQVKFMTIMSIGCRDNNKLDSDIVLLSNINKKNAKIFSEIKDLYADSLEGDGASWQSARAFLPQSYSHSYYFSQNLLAISNALNSFKEFYIDNETNENNNYRKYALNILYKKFIVKAISEKFPLIGLYLDNILDIKKKENFLSKILPNMKYEDLSNIDKKYFEIE